MKIITCAPLPEPHGGITNWYRIFCEEAAMHDIELVNIDISPHNKKMKKNIVYRVFFQGFHAINLAIKLAKAIKENKETDIAHITTSGSLGLFRDVVLMLNLKLFDKKIVYHIHHGKIPQIYKKKGFEYKVCKLAIGMADVTIAIDPYTYKTLNNHHVDKKIVYVPNPVEDVGLTGGVENKEICFLGNVVKDKGVEELLAAWSEIVKKHPNWRLNIVGRCDELYKKKLLQIEEHNVYFYGFLEHRKAMEILNESSFLVLPSYSEGFPNVILEAMVRGKPVIGTDVGAIKDMLHGKCGIVIEPRNVIELVNAIEKIINNTELLNEYSQNARSKAKEKYISNKVFEQYLFVWNELT